MSSVDTDGEDGNGFILCKKIAKFFKFSSCLEKIAKKIILLNLLSSSQVQAIEKESGRVGLKLNTKKTKAMFFNTPPTTVQTLEGKSIGQAITKCGRQDFKYLGSWCDQTNDLHTRKA